MYSLLLKLQMRNEIPISPNPLLNWSSDLRVLLWLSAWPKIASNCLLVSDRNPFQILLYLRRNTSTIYILITWTHKPFSICLVHPDLVLFHFLTTHLHFICFLIFSHWNLHVIFILWLIISERSRLWWVTVTIVNNIILTCCCSLWLLRHYNYW